MNSPTTKRPLTLHIPGLTAIGEYDTVRVTRSAEFDTGSEAYASVRWFIRAYGLVLAEQKTVDDKHHGEAVSEWYVKPQGRIALCSDL